MNRYIFNAALPSIVLVASTETFGRFSATNASPNQTPPAAVDKSSADAVIVFSAGLEGLLVDAKDKGLLSALRMIDQRLAELPRETGRRDVPVPAIRLALELMFSPMTMRAGLLDPMGGGQANHDGQRPPFYVQFDVARGDAEKAQSFAGRFSGMLASLPGVPRAQNAPEFPGMQQLDLQGVALFFGVLKRGEAPSFTIAVNKVIAADDAALSPRELAPQLPRDVSPSLAFVLDAPKLQPAIDMALAQAGSQAATARLQLQGLGLYGPDASRMSVAFGFGADRAHVAARFTNFGRIMKANHSAPAQRLSVGDLRRVPADATYAQISKYNFAALGEMIRQSIAQTAAAAPDAPPPDPMALLEQQMGINPQRDVFEHLGQTAGAYMSDTTGGGGFFSLVAFIEVKNSDALKQTIARLAGMVNQLGQQKARGYVRVGEKTLGNQKMTTLNFPGVPVPFEVCLTIADGYLYAAVSPQAILAAVDQVRSAKSSLLDNPRFKEMGGEGIADAIKVSFIDTPRLMRSGFGVVSMGAAALENLVRSPSDLQRDPGSIMPSYTSLATGAKAAVYVTKLQGDDLVVTGQYDRSVLVNACGAMGMIGSSTGSIAVAAMFTGMLLPALEKARETAKATKSMAQLRGVGMAYMTYASEHRDAFPRSVEALVEGEYINADILRSPFGPAMDGDDDYWFDSSGRRLATVREPNRQVLGYDRTMYASGRNVAVLFYDGHVQTMTKAEFRELIAAAPNAGIDFNLPGDGVANHDEDEEEPDEEPPQ